MADAADVAQELSAYWQRMLLRFDSDDPIVTAIDTAMNSFAQAMNEVSDLIRDLDQDGLDRFDDLRSKFTRGHIEFLHQSRIRFGVTAEG